MPIKSIFFLSFTVTTLLATAISYGKIYAFHLCLVGAWGYFFYAVYTQKTSVRSLVQLFFKPVLFVFFPLSLVWFSAHILLADYKIAALEHLTQLFLGTSVLFLVQYFTHKDDDLFLRMLQAMAIVLVVNMGLCFGEMTGLVRYPISDYSAWCGLFGHTVKYNHIIEMAAISLGLAEAKQLIDTTPTGFYCNPNDCATVVSFAFPFFLLYPKKRISFLGLTCVVFICVGASARLVLLAICLMWFFAWLFVDKTRWKNYLFALFLLVGAFTHGYGLLPQSWRQADEMNLIKKKDTSFNDEKAVNIGNVQVFKQDNSTNIRKTLIIKGVETAKQHYGIGIGGGNMGARLAAAGGVGNHKVKILHNFWLEWLVEGGVIWAILFAAWYGLLLFRLFRESQKLRFLSVSTTFNTLTNNTYFTTTNYLPAATFLALVGFILAAIAQGTCIYYLPMYLLFAIALRLTNSTHES